MPWSLLVYNNDEGHLLQRGLESLTSYYLLYRLFMLCGSVVFPVNDVNY